MSIANIVQLSANFLTITGGFVFSESSLGADELAVASSVPVSVVPKIC
jgi:hypothetical protein